MSVQFSVTADVRGDLYSTGGMVRNLTAEVIIDVGTENTAFFLGGSGLNLVLSGFPAAGFNGVWRWHHPNVWKSGDLTLTADPAGGAVIADETDDVATLATGGPVGSYASTAHGETRFGAAFVAAAAAESNAPGALPAGTVDVSGGTAQTGSYEHDSGAIWRSTVDTDWTIEIDYDGAAVMSDGTDVVAFRSDGDPGSPEGVYEATLYGQLTYHPAAAPEVIAAPADPDADPAPHSADDPTELTPTTETDPDVELPTDATPDPDPEPEAADAVFGVLEVIYSWPAEPDLDDKTTFLTGTVGYSYGYSAAYMTHSGDDTSTAGSETVTIDLAAAYAAAAITDVATVYCHADWYPIGASGPATLTVRYTLQGETTEFSAVISPGNERPSTKLQTVLKIAARNPLPVLVPQAWQAAVTMVPNAAPEGVVFLAVTEVDGILDSCATPAFAGTLPSNTAETFHVAIASTDGASTAVRPLWTGPLLWRDVPTPGADGADGTGLAWVSLTMAAYDALDPKDPDTIYDLTDLLP